MKKKVIIISIILAVVLGLSAISIIHIIRLNKKEQLLRRQSIITVTYETPSRIRDPFVLYYNNKYYVYSTGWYLSCGDDLRETFSTPKTCVEIPEDFLEQPWAPEVYLYDDKFYMLTTYRSSKNKLRGCAVFVSDTPEGPFKLHSDGTITPKEYDSIDGTLYIDESGQPWMIYTQEYTTAKDGLSRTMCAKLSKDLKEFLDTPVELFNKSDTHWSNGLLTEGNFVYKTKNGKLIMIWSDFIDSDYALSFSVSDGNILGPWKHSKKPFYSKDLHGELDGGHGMIFKDRDGLLWLALHSPNTPPPNGTENLALIPIVEENDTIKWDFSKRN